MAGEAISGTGFQLTDFAVVFATLLGPVLAVQAQKLLEKGRAIKERRNHIFRVLMATRGAMLSPEHVQALNAIPVEFYGSGTELKRINDKWKEFLDHHSPDSVFSDAWLQKRLDLFLDLVHLISVHLGYSFSRSQLYRDIYSPKAHGELENDQENIRKGIIKLLSGEIVLPVSILSLQTVSDGSSTD